MTIPHAGRLILAAAPLLVLGPTAAGGQAAATPVLTSANGAVERIDTRAGAATLPATALAAATAVRGVHKALARLGRSSEARVWPGFRPDTIPVMYVLPEQGTLLAGWSGALPDGFAAVTSGDRLAWRAEVDRAAASTGTIVGGRGVAQVVVHTLAPAELYALSVHEAFHVFQRASARDGQRFGRSENSLLAARYPVFDVANEAEVALEGKALAAALRTTTDPELRARAREFVAVREARHRRLGSEFAGFESGAELNEGLAQYAAIRALTQAAHDPLVPWARDAIAAYARELAALDSLTADAGRSFRLRFYSTGPAMALLLDRLSGPSWKARLLRDDLTLQDALAQESGYRAAEAELRRDAARQVGDADLRALAATAISALRARRLRMLDSMFATPGLRLAVATDRLPGGDIGLCGFDPQNLLQVDDGVLVHTRWLNACAGPALDAEFTTPVVQDRTGRALVATIGDPDSVRISVAGSALTLAEGDELHAAAHLVVESPTLRLRAARADVRREKGTLRVRPY